MNFEETFLSLNKTIQTHLSRSLGHPDVISSKFSAVSTRLRMHLAVACISFLSSSQVPIAIVIFVSWKHHAGKDEISKRH